MEILLGITALLMALALFSLFSFKAPHGSAAMSGLADAAIATFLVEAIHKYVMGNLLGIGYLAEFGNLVGGMGGVAAATLVMLRVGVQPVFAMVTGLAMIHLGILEGFIVGYLFSFIAPLFKKYLSGYGMWGWRDWRDDKIFNGAFELGRNGWKGNFSMDTKSKNVILDKDDMIEQSINPLKGAMLFIEYELLGENNILSIDDGDSQIDLALINHSIIEYEYKSDLIVNREALSFRLIGS